MADTATNGVTLAQGRTIAGVVLFALFSWLGAGLWQQQPQGAKAMQELTSWKENWKPYVDRELLAFQSLQNRDIETNTQCTQMVDLTKALTALLRAQHTHLDAQAGRQIRLEAALERIEQQTRHRR